MCKDYSVLLRYAKNGVPLMGRIRPKGRIYLPEEEREIGIGEREVEVWEGDNALLEVRKWLRRHGWLTEEVPCGGVHAA
jgi:hypothetical protein